MSSDYGVIYGHGSWDPENFGTIKIGTYDSQGMFYPKEQVVHNEPKPVDWVQNEQKKWLESLPPVTEQDPNGVDQHKPGAKLDAGKPDASLLKDFGKALLEVAKVSTKGAIKYSRGGWQEVPDGHNRYTAAMMRHFFQEKYEDIDEDTQMLHMAQVAWNALARLELYLRES